MLTLRLNKNNKKSDIRKIDDWDTITNIVTSLSNGTIDFVEFKNDLLQDIQLENFAGKEAVLEANKALLRCLARLRAIEHVLPTPESKTRLKPNFAKLVYLILSIASNNKISASKNIQNIHRYEREFNSYLIQILSDAKLASGCETKEQYEALLSHYQNLASLLDKAEPIASTASNSDKSITLKRALHPVTEKTAEQKKFIEEKYGDTVLQTDAINLATSKFKDLLLDDTRCLQGNNIGILPTVQNAFVVESEIMIGKETNTVWYAHTESPVYVGKVPSEKIRQEQALQNVLQISNTTKEVTDSKFSATHLTYLETDTSTENQIIIDVLDVIKKSKPTIDRSCLPKLPRNGNKNLATVVGFNQDIQEEYPQLEKAQKISSIIAGQESTLEIIFSQSDLGKTATSCKGSEFAMHEPFLKELKNIVQVKKLIEDSEGRKIPSVNSNNLISFLPNQQRDHVLFSEQLTTKNFKELFSNAIIRETLNGIYNYERDEGSNGKRGLIRARFYREALESDQYTELQKYIVILALLSSSDGKRLKKAVEQTASYHGVDRNNLITKITTESSIEINILNVITGKLLAAANHNNEKQFKRVVEVCGDVLKHYPALEDNIPEEVKNLVEIRGDDLLSENEDDFTTNDHVTDFDDETVDDLMPGQEPVEERRQKLREDSQKLRRAHYTKMTSGTEVPNKKIAHKEQIAFREIPVDRTAYKGKIFNLLSTLDITRFQSHTEHSVLPEIQQIAQMPKKNSDKWDSFSDDQEDVLSLNQFDDKKWKSIQSKCRDNTTGFKNWYAKSSLTFFSKGRHTAVDFIYRAVSDENNVHSRMIDKFDEIEAQRTRLESSINSGSNTSALFQKSVKKYYKNIRYAAEKDSENNEFKVDEKKLCELQLERKMMKLLQSEIDRLLPDIADSHIKILAYKNLIDQIQQSGVANLNFDQELDLRWTEDVKIKVPGKETVIKNKKAGDEITIEDALCWNRGFGIKTTSATVYQEILDLQAEYAKIPVKTNQV